MDCAYRRMCVCEREVVVVHMRATEQRGDVAQGRPDTRARLRAAPLSNFGSCILQISELQTLVEMGAANVFGAASCCTSCSQFIYNLFI